MRLPGLHLVLALACGLAGPALAQEPTVDPAFIPQNRPDFGNRLPLCIWPESTMAAIDRQVARDIAEVLLLKPDPVDIETDIDMVGGTGVWPVIRIALARDCLGVMGAKLNRRGQVPDWLTVTRPYLEAPYVLISDGVETLGDLPAGARVATPLSTPIDLSLITLVNSGGRWDDLVRVPYDRPALARRLMEQGAVDAAIVWQPYLETPTLQGDYYETVGSTEPLDVGERGLGIVLHTRDTALRANLDEAIAALREEPGWPAGKAQ